MNKLDSIRKQIEGMKTIGYFDPKQIANTLELILDIMVMKEPDKKKAKSKRNITNIKDRLSD